MQEMEVATHVVAEKQTRQRSLNELEWNESMFSAEERTGKKRKFVVAQHAAGCCRTLRNLCRAGLYGSLEAPVSACFV